MGATWAKLLIALQVAAVPASTADDPDLTRLATCQDSWEVLAKSDPARLKGIVDRFRADFSPKEGDSFFVPKTAKSVAGLPVTQAFPQSVGMGVGFSVVVDATFDETRKRIEAMLGKPIGKCEASDNSRYCELAIGKRRTFVMIADDSPAKAATLVGCYYYYEK